MAITLAQLRTFLAVEHTSSIKGAAAELRVTQPSVSSGLAALEKAGYVWSSAGDEGSN